MLIEWLEPATRRIDGFARLVAGPWHLAYAGAWIAASLAAAAVALASQRRLLGEARAYAAFLAVPWKVATAVPAIAFVALAGRWTTDPNWDVPTGLGMALAAFLGAPWALGALWGAAAGRRPRGDAYVAACLWLASAGWGFDAWQWHRAGSYPVTWLGNLDLSACIYACAGIVWSLEVRDGRPALGFARPDWPAPPADRSFARLVAPALPPAIVGFLLLVGYVGWRR